jgi:membrane protein YdbS with pleckstrin-like domain
MLQATRRRGVEEKTVWTGTSSQVLNFWIFVMCGLVFAVLLVLLVYFWPQLQPLGAIAIVPAFVILLSPLGYAWVKAIIVRAKRYEITTERIRISSGIFSKSSSAMELYRVKDYTMQVPFFYRLFHLGNIYITTSDHSTPLLTLPAIPNARQLMDDIRTHVENRRDMKGVREVDFDQVANTAPR